MGVVVEKKRAAFMPVALDTGDSVPPFGSYWAAVSRDGFNGDTGSSGFVLAAFSDRESAESWVEAKKAEHG